MAGIDGHVDPIKAVKCTQSDGLEKEHSQKFIFLSSLQSTQTRNPPPPKWYVSVIIFQLLCVMFC
jgi:hypothetical protein